MPHISLHIIYGMLIEYCAQKQLNPTVFLIYIFINVYFDFVKCTDKTLCTLGIFWTQMCQFSWKWMDWDQKWCKCFGSVSWCPKGRGKICRGLKKLFNIIWSFFGFALTICFFLIFTQILDDIILKCTQCFVCTFYKIKINIHKNVN